MNPQEHQSIRDEIERIAPGLSSRLPREEPIPPVDYFAGMQNRVLAKVRERSLGGARPVRIGTPFLRAAAAITLLAVVLGGWWTYRSASGEKLAALPTESMAAWLEDALCEADEDLLLEYVLDEHYELPLLDGADTFPLGDDFPDLLEEDLF